MTPKLGYRTVGETGGGAMAATKPDISYKVEVKVDASPEAIYSVLSDPNKSMEWSGKKAPMIFRLRDLQAPAGPLTTGQSWTSHGVVGYYKFEDRSTVVNAEPGRAFGFDTDSNVPRKIRSAPWKGHFENRYTIRPDGNGSIITYTCDGFTVDYTSFMWWPAFKPMTRAMYTMMIKGTIKKLGRQAAETNARAA